MLPDWAFALVCSAIFVLLTYVLGSLTHGFAHWLDDKMKERT